MLYLFGIGGTSPLLTPVSVNTSTHQLTVQPYWSVFQNTPASQGNAASGASSDRAYYAPYVLAGTSGDGTLGIASAGRIGNVDRLLAVYPGKRSSTSNDQVGRVVEVDITATSTVSGVSTSPVTTITNDTASGHASQVTLVPGASGSRTAMVYWKAIDSGANCTTLADGGTSSDGCTVYMKSASMTPSALVLVIETGTPELLSTTTNGSLRTRTGWQLTGDYVKGAGYRTIDSSGFPMSKFVAQWGRPMRSCVVVSPRGKAISSTAIPTGGRLSRSRRTGTSAGTKPNAPPTRSCPRCRRSHRPRAPIRSCAMIMAFR